MLNSHRLEIHEAVVAKRGTLERMEDMIDRIRDALREKPGKRFSEPELSRLTKAAVA